MQLPPMLQGESLTRLLQGAALGVAGTIFVGFYWAGWSLPAASEKLARDRSDTAVVAALAPICAEKFRALPNADARQIALVKADSWKRVEEFPKELVTPPGQSFPSNALVEACYVLLNPKPAGT